MLLLKAFSLALIAGIGRMMAFNRESNGNSEEVFMNEIGKGTKDVEKGWGEKKNEKEVQVSFWKQGKGDEGWKRSKAGRKETHSDIYIFDLCNEWIEFAGRGDRNQRDDRDNDESGGYGYLWRDICQIVKNEKSEVKWLEFITSAINSNIVKVNQEGCCGKDQICNGDRNWNKGEWLQKCFEKEIKESNLDKKRKRCKSLWEETSEVRQVSSGESKNLCIEEEIIKKISKRIKISREEFGDKGIEGNNQGNKYWCNEDNKNGYKSNNGKGNIKDECKNILKEKIKEFVKKVKDTSKPSDRKNVLCQGIYEKKEFEVKCEDGWAIKNSKS